MISKSRFLSFALFFCAFLWSISSWAENGAFGLTWGMSKAEVEQLGVDINAMEGEDGLKVFETASLPKDVSISEYYGLYFGEGAGLQKILMVSENITGDPYGNEGKKQYSRLKEALTEKYGQPDATEVVGLELWDESDEFYQCLAYQGCGAWASLFKSGSDRPNILLQVKGHSRGQGYIELHYEGPRWNAVMEQVREKKAEKDMDAL